MKRIQKQNLELRLALQLQGANIVRNRPLPSQQKREKDQTDYEEARDNLLTLYKPEVVYQFLEGLSRTQIETINIYWTDLQKILATKRKPTKSIFLKILSKFI
jgi:hypothetical protein